MRKNQEQEEDGMYSARSVVEIPLRGSRETASLSLGRTRGLVDPHPGK